MSPNTAENLPVHGVEAKKKPKLELVDSPRAELRDVSAAVEARKDTALALRDEILRELNKDNLIIEDSYGDDIARAVTSDLEQATAKFDAALRNAEEGLNSTAKQIAIAGDAKKIDKDLDKVKSKFVISKEGEMNNETAAVKDIIDKALRKTGSYEEPRDLIIQKLVEAGYEGVPDEVRAKLDANEQSLLPSDEEIEKVAQKISKAKRQEQDDKDWAEYHGKREKIKDQDAVAAAKKSKAEQKSSDQAWSKYHSKKEALQTKTEKANDALAESLYTAIYAGYGGLNEGVGTASKAHSVEEAKINIMGGIQHYFENKRGVELTQEALDMLAAKAEERGHSAEGIPTLKEIINTRIELDRAKAETEDEAVNKKRQEQVTAAAAKKSKAEQKSSDQAWSKYHSNQESARKAAEKSEKTLDAGIEKANREQTELVQSIIEKSINKTSKSDEARILIAQGIAELGWEEVPEEIMSRLSDADAELVPSKIAISREKRKIDKAREEKAAEEKSRAESKEKAAKEKAAAREAVLRAGREKIEADKKRIAQEKAVLAAAKAEKKMSDDWDVADEMNKKFDSDKEKSGEKKWNGLINKLDVAYNSVTRSKVGPGLAGSPDISMYDMEVIAAGRAAVAEYIAKSDQSLEEFKEAIKKYKNGETRDNLLRMLPTGESVKKAQARMEEESNNKSKKTGFFGAISNFFSRKK